ncbi:pirin family protein [Xanthomonadaceae bacterium JHOS43]|nr:pirin family protein [Xanthomonadaceae bacterium JHOS43]
MDIILHPSRERGRTRLSWLDSRHSFSFGHYYEPRRMGFGALRVINEDIVAPGAGFPPHSHANMEIVSIVLAGALAHRDSLGSSDTIQAGDVQRMCAGSGIEHSEYNASQTEPVHFLQIWIVPQRQDRTPGYAQRHFPLEQRDNRWCLVVSPDGRDDSLSIDQQAHIHLTRLDAGKTLEHALEPGQRAWLQLTRGRARLNGHPLAAGDGAAVCGSGVLLLEADSPVEACLFQLQA